MTGSYLGRLLEKEFFLPAGDLEDLTLETLTFAEFTEVFGIRDRYETVDLYGGSESERYQQLRECYELYKRIGGYPSVVARYLAHKDLERCDTELAHLMGIFTNESKRYFDDVMETESFEQLFHEIAITLIREKQGVRDLVEDLSKILFSGYWHCSILSETSRSG